MAPRPESAMTKVSSLFRTAILLCQLLPMKTHALGVMPAPTYLEPWDSLDSCKSHVHTLFADIKVKANCPTLPELAWFIFIDLQSKTILHYSSPYYVTYHKFEGINATHFWAIPSFPRVLWMLSEPYTESAGSSPLGLFRLLSYLLLSLYKHHHHYITTISPFPPFPSFILASLHLFSILLFLHIIAPL